MYETSRVTICNDLHYIEPLIEYVKSVSTQVGLNAKETNRICYALEENLQNSILSDFEADEIEDIKIDISRIAAGLKITISDDGVPKNPFIKTPKSLDEIASEISFDSIEQNSSDQMSAISDFVIHKLLDKYSYHNLGKAGRKVEMIIYASQSRISEEQADNKKNTIKEMFTNVRPAKPSDITGISRLFYKSYGYSYVNDIVYYPERLAKAIETEALISAIGYSNHDRVIGHIALMQPYENAKITEWGMAISDPEFRGQGVMTQLIDTIMSRADSSSFMGIFSHSVTNHEFTQKICTSHAFSDVALLVGYAGSTLSFKKINNELKQRESTIISFKTLKSFKQPHIYMPQKHKAMIEKLYLGIGIETVEKTEQNSSSKSTTKLKDTIIPAINIAEIVLESAGEDALTSIKHATKKICIAKVDIIYLLLNLEDFGAINIVDELENIGYFFGGIFPYYRHDNTLVLQYVNNIKFDYSLINAHTSLAKELKNYIQAQDTNQISEE